VVHWLLLAVRASTRSKTRVALREPASSMRSQASVIDLTHIKPLYKPEIPGFSVRERFYGHRLPIQSCSGRQRELPPERDTRSDLMPRESTPDARESLRSYADMERDVLYLLTGMSGDQPLWSEPDLAREIESTDTDVVVRGLRQAGLIHRTSDGFVFASRAGVRAVQMSGHVV
jgi:hypothetical protein